MLRSTDFPPSQIIQTNKMFVTDRVEYTNKNAIKYTVLSNPQNASFTINTPIFTKNPNSRFVESHKCFDMKKTVNATETRMYQRSVGWDSPDLDRAAGICEMIS
jgi:hypothetical protein